MTTDLPSEEKISMENFALLRVLGKGAYGKVFLVRKIGGKDHGQVYAMKVLRKVRVLSKPKTLEHTLAERQVLERLRGIPFLVNLYYAFQTDTKLHIVMEYVRGGELFTHLCSRGAFDVAAAKFIIAELIIAIDSLHKRKVIYRDLKLENILLDENGHVKLTDFGLSKLLVPEELERANSYCGTIEYMSPEVINRPEGGYSDVVDWWSMGVISFELLTGCSPFTVDGAANSSKEIAKRIISKKVPFPRNMDPDAKDFIGSLLEKKLEKRLGYNGVEEIKNHRFLRDIDWNKAANRQLTPFIVPNITHELDVQNFATEFTNQQPLYSPAESPINANALFRGYSYISPSVIFANNNIIGEELMQEDIQALLANSSFFGKYKLDTTEKGYLGRGSFSVVRRCERIEDGAMFAVKIVSQRFATQAQREARILDIVRGHINIVRLVDVHSDPLHYYIVMELLTGQELLVRLRKLEKFTEAEAADIMRQLVSAVGFLHAKRIVHRDLKPENILFESEDPHALLRLVDFGFARLLPACVEQQLKSVYRKMTPCFTLQYAAPEVLDLGDTLPEYNEQCDLWSLGVILFTMLSGQVPFHARSKTESATEIMQRIRKAEFSFEGDAWRAVSAEAKQLINGLLTVDPKKRLSMQELSRHKWLHSSASLETPLQTPSVLPSFAGETFNETLQAFLTANRDGFHLMEVDAAPLMKRRGLKRQSAEKEASEKASKRVAAFETVPEEHSTSSTPRPTQLGMISPDVMMNYRIPPAGTIRDTRGSDSS
ncbi:kinase domain protein [Necator americanus]|uniref:Ribosomal protein S6 kinase n=1 Tax=Necator americanus TaxID=51031 RepID=W2SQ40_NECAM|nr:kinase domain protein [Necator americanus]ETN70787.1 kinase domain protein [Necator americanus]